MKISQAFIKKHCPCFKTFHCPDRKAGCHNTCAEWHEWQQKREAERERLLTASITDRYVANINSECVQRKTQYKARKNYPNKYRKKSKFE